MILNHNYSKYVPTFEIVQTVRELMLIYLEIITPLKDGTGVFASASIIPSFHNIEILKRF